MTNPIAPRDEKKKRRGNPACGQRRGWAWLWGGYALVLFAVMHVPVPTGGLPRVRFADKLAHFAAYFVLVRLGGTYLAQTPAGLRGLRIVRWGALYVAYGAVDEALQPYSGRTASLSDWAADVAGIAAASVSLYIWPGRAARAAADTGRRADR